VPIADPHCGARSGLTPPKYQWPSIGGTDQRNRWGRFQKEGWERYLEIVDRIAPPIDVLFMMGDGIDGRGEQSGGRELITPNRNEQVEIAYECLKVWEARKVICITGTAYHTGRLEDFETNLAKDLGGELHSHPFVKVEGVTFDLKHKIGRSGIPHGQGTTIAKERLWNTQWWIDGEGQPLADIVLRAHIHKFHFDGGANWLAMSLPCLQGATIYGSREVSGTVDWGLIEFSVDAGEYEWTKHIVHLKGFKQEVIHV